MLLGGWRQVDKRPMTSVNHGHGGGCCGCHALLCEVQKVVCVGRGGRRLPVRVCVRLYVCVLGGEGVVYAYVCVYACAHLGV